MSSTALRIIANDRNLVRGATLVASAQRPSADLRLVASTQAGGGALALVGAYTGAADTVVDVEVLSGTGTALQPSAPVLAGVGSGTLSVLSVDAAAVPEALTLRLVSAGTPARAATLPFFGVVLRARSAGQIGNALTMQITRRIVYAPTSYSALAGIAAGTADLEGPQWDWGAPAGHDEQIPATAPRLALEGGAQIHRHWRTWVGDRWVWHLDPAPVGAVAAGTRVLEVSGDYLLRITDGSASEEYSAVTIFEAVRAIAARSALVDVVGTVAEDRAPGGMAVTDIPLRTDAYPMPLVASIRGGYGVPRLDAITVQPDAPTELVTITRLASGRWSVAGSVSGALAEATAGRAYADGPVAFTIPAAVIPAGEDGGAFAHVALRARDENATIPALCITPRLGRAAAPQSVVFTYTRRPRTACSCTAYAAPYLSAACLGWGEEDTMTLAPAVASRVDTIYAWRRGVAAAQTRWVPGRAAYTEMVGAMPAVPGQYRVRVSGTGSYKQPGSGGVSWTFAGYVRAAFSSEAAAQTVASAIAGAVNGTWGGQSVTINGYIVDIVNLPYPFISQWFTTWPTWATATETMVAEVPAVAGTPVEHPEQQAGWEGAASEFTAIDAVLDVLFACLGQVHEVPAALAAWDVLWAEARAEFDLRINTTAGEDARLRNQAWLRRWADACDQIRTTAGIYPSFDFASTGRACWQDNADAAYWWVDTTGQYLPAFSNHAWVSARRNGEVITPTYEFGFGLAVACPEALMEGDSFTIVCRGAMGDGYDAGDRYELPIVAAAAAMWSGGMAGDDTHTWAVRGSVSGAAPDWTWDPTAPTAYSGGVVGLAMAPGGIPFATGDTWALALEGGTLRWRRDGGAWATAELFGASPALGDGLSLAIAAGAAPSFEAGDAWIFDARAAYGAGQLRQPREGQAWAWPGASATLSVDLGAAHPLEVILLALHTLPSGAGITLSGGLAGAGEWHVPMTWQAGPILHVLPAATTARYLALAITGAGADGASLGWLWAGAPWAPTVGPSAMIRTHEYRVTRGAGLNPRGLYRGRGQGARWTWSLDAGAPLLADDIAGLLALLDHVAEQDGEWVALVPDLAAPADCLLAKIEADEVSLDEHPGWRMADGSAMVSVDLPFRAVLG